jgi:formylglycine-generating enzyme required for sulfatase activity
MGEEASRTHDVFLSYSSKDKNWADAACVVLERHRLRCWIAPRDITPGEEWGASIIKGINGSRMMVLIFSGHANASGQVRREVERAISQGMSVLPVRIEDVRPEGAMEYALGNTHWLDAFRPPIERHLESLARSVKRLLGHDVESVDVLAAEKPSAVVSARSPEGSRVAGEFRDRSAHTGMIHVFVSYRREDSIHQAGRLYDRLVTRFGSSQVFKDVDSIPLGSDFREVLTERVADCDVFLAVIGDRWLSIAGKSGERRLDDPGDFVRIEIEAALSRKIPVIPVLVANSSVPQAEELPESLRGLSFRNGLPVRPDPDFHKDMDRLIRGIEDGVSALRNRSTLRGPKSRGPEAQESADKGSSIDLRGGLSATVKKPGDTSQPLPEQFGRYRIIKRLGQGVMGSVYLAEDTPLGRRVVLKVPDLGPESSPEARERFLDHARTAATLDHPYLCPVYDVGEIDGNLFLTMAYIEGQSLAALIGDEGWPQRQGAALVGNLALAMQEVHKKKVIHRDLKPTDVVIKATGERREPVIIDLGLGYRDNPEDQRLNRLGQNMGTLAYMAPEQIRGDLKEIGPACDVYALGVILYELLTGRLPFSGSGLAIAGQILTMTPLPPSTHRSGVDPALDAICLKAMAKEAGDRFDSMRAFAEVLNSWQERLASPAPKPPSPEETTPAPPESEPAAKSVTSKPTDPKTNEFAESIGIKLRLIPAGEFEMGSPYSDRKVHDDERPEHKVQITRPFCIGVYAVTQGQYRAVTGKNPSRFRGLDDHPVERVSWNEAIAFCNSLSERACLKPYYRSPSGEVTGGDGYRLPTEAEWEYACRAGSTARYSFGDDATNLGEYAWHSDNSGNKTHPVGQKRPNAFGLYDMEGNVCEWCQDHYDPAYYEQSPAFDPDGPSPATRWRVMARWAPIRVVRGGGWSNPSEFCRSAIRGASRPGGRLDYVGFRVARSPSAP